MTEEPESIVKRNWHALLKDYFPDALISDRTALENRPANDGSVFIISSGTRDLALPGITFKPAGAIPLWKATVLFSMPSASVPSLAPGWKICGPRQARRRGFTDVVKRGIGGTAGKPASPSGEEALNQLRDDARAISQELKMQEEFHELDNLIGAFLGTRDVKLTTDTGKARQKGLPYDPERVELFMKLFSELNPCTRHTTCGGNEGISNTNLAFFEAYFSNYIEGTEFAVEEAVDIVFKGVIPEDRPEDAHDVLGTYRIVSDKRDMKRIPRDFESFISLLKERHASFMELRPDKRPGEFKSKPNRAGTTVFVTPDLVTGTLAKGFEIYRGLEAPFHRAVFMMCQLLRLLGYSALELSEDLDPLLRLHLGELVEVVARYLEPWVERGELHCANAKTLVLTLIAIVLSRGPLRRVFVGDSASLPAMFETYSEFCLD